MENFSYHVPFYVVTNGVATQGFTSDLAGGQVGLFDRQTWAVATQSGNGQELFFSQGTIPGKGWYGEPVTESHKSPFFYAKNITNIYKSPAHKIQNEEWIIGYDGSQSSKSLEYIKGKPTSIKLYFHGEPAYRMFNGPKEYVVTYTPPADCTDDCATECGGERLDPKPHVMKHIDLFNNHVELKKLGVRVGLVDSEYVAGTMTREKYSITIKDGGTLVDLAKLQGKYPGKKITKVSRTGIDSTYEFNQPIADSAPANFTYEGLGFAEAICGSCPSGWTTVAAQDTYFIKRQIAAGDNFTTDDTKDTFADTVGTAYSVTPDGDKTFIGTNGSQAIIQIKVAGGTVVNPIGSDEVQLIKSVGAICQAPAGASVAWTLGDNCISGSRTLKIKLNRDECDMAGNRTADVTAALQGVKGVQIGTLAVIAGDACVDEYTVVQNSDDCLDESCLTSNVTFTFDTPLPAIDGKSWEIVDPTLTAVNDRKVGMRISAGYYDPKFGTCSFDPYDYYETMPLKFELSLLKEGLLSGCEYANLATTNKVKNARISRQSGEWVVREVIMKTEAYLEHTAQWSSDPRMREAFDMSLLDTVGRSSYYTLWYVSYPTSFNKTSRTGEQHKFTTVFAVKESDGTTLAALETNIINVLAAKSGVVPHVNE